MRPDLVVDVQRAVNLLMSIEMFVVVVAVDPPFPNCADIYRQWSVKIARYGFETYKEFTQDDQDSEWSS